jgi:predicted dinucleotide-binding enzyme
MNIRPLLFALSLIVSAATCAETVAVIGTGNVGAALGTEMALQGHDVVYGSREPLGLKALDLAGRTKGNASTARPADAVIDANIVILAVPGMVVEEVVNQLGDLAGKIVIDATNPLVMGEPMHFTYGVTTSNGEIVQAAAPDAKVVKAFNTVTWQSMIDPEEADGPLYVPLAGDDDDAKALVAELVEAMGLESIDLGGIENSHWTEYSVVVSLNNQFSKRQNFDLLFRVIE